MTPYKILYLHPSNELYGADRSLLRLVKLLNSTNYKPYVAVPNDLVYEGLLTAELGKNKIPFQELKLGILRRQYKNLPGLALFLYRTIASSLYLAKYVKKQKIDLIHSNSTAVVTGGLLSRLTKIPHVWHVREIITHPVWLNRIIAKTLMLSANKVISVSGPVKNNLILVEPNLNAKTVIIHNGINLLPFAQVNQSQTVQLKQTWQIPDNSLIIGMVGRISSWKGQELLVQAASKVIQNRPNVHVVLVGGGVPGETFQENKLKQLITKLNVQNQVHIKQFRLDIPVVLSTFDIFVLPSTKPDPFPTVVLEAMAAKKPIIATAHGGAIEQIEDGISGMLVSPTDATNMTQALEKLIAQPELRQKMGEAAQKRALQHFSVARYVKDIEMLYKDILTNSKKR